MKLVLHFLLMIMTIQIQAEEGTSSSANYPMSARYRAGSNLIYDCRDKFYACVDSDGHLACREERDTSIKYKNNRYPCAPLKKFKDKDACLVKNYEVIESVAFKRFCFPKS